MSFHNFFPDIVDSVDFSNVIAEWDGFDDILGDIGLVFDAFGFLDVLAIIIF